MPEQRFYPDLIPLPRKIEFGVSDTDIRDWTLEVAGEAASRLSRRYLRELPLGECGSRGTARLVHDDTTSIEGYRLSIGERELEVRASTERGFFYALQTLRQLMRNSRVPLCLVEDSPALGTRGFHLDLETVRGLNFETISRIIKNAASWKLNTLLIEYGDRFPYRRHADINAGDALSMREVRDLVHCARDNYIEIIPLTQSLAHLGYALKHDRYAGLREVDGEFNQLCASNPASLAFVGELLDEVINAHGPDLKRIHLGADETRSLGACPQCAARAAAASKETLYAEHINSLCGTVANRGLQPIIWDDMVCAHPDALEKLDRRITIMYWDYWSVDDKSPLLIARYRGTDCQLKRVIVYDRYWDEPSQANPYRNTGNFHSRGGEDLRGLGGDFMSRFGKYLGSEFPLLIKSFPYLEYYRDHGFKTLGAPSCLGQRFDMDDGLENFNRTIPNMRGFAARCAEAGADGMVTTAWFNYPVEFLYYGLLATAQYAWNGRYGFKT